MSHIKLADIEVVVRPYGFSVKPGRTEHAKLFENDMAESDQYEFGRTPLRDWRAALYETFQISDECFIASSPWHGGSVVFGVVKSAEAMAQVWLLQSKSFAAEASRHHGRAWPRQFVMMTTGVIKIFLNAYPLLYNFIPESQKNTIRWLHRCGFSFYACNALDTDMLFFGQGRGVNQLAQNIQMWRTHLGNALRD